MQARQPQGVVAARRLDGRERTLVFGAVAVVAVALLLAPLQTMLIMILIGTMALLIEGLATWLRLRRTSPEQQTLTLRRAAVGGAAIVAVGAVVAAIWPMAMAVTTLLLAAGACALNAYARWSTRPRPRRGT